MASTSRALGKTPPLAIIDWDPSWDGEGMVWLPSGELALLTGANPERLVRIPSVGGVDPTVVSLSADVEGDIALQGALGDGRILAELDTWKGGYRVDAVVIDPNSGGVTVLVENAARPKLSSSSHLVFSRQDSLLAVPFALTEGRLLSGAVSISSGVRADAYNFRAEFDLGLDGTMVAIPGGEVGGKRRLVVIDGESSVPWSKDELRVAPNSKMDISHDGRWLALTLMNEKGLYEVWGSEVDRPALRRLVSFPNLDCSSPVWSSRAELLAVRCNGAGDGQGIYLLNMATSSEPQLVYARRPGKPSASPELFLPGETEILCREGGGENTELLKVPIAGGDSAEPETLLGGAGTIRTVALSQDGSKLAYVSNDSGRFEVILRALMEDGSLGPVNPIFAGLSVEWGRNSRGKEVLYVLTPDQNLVAMSVGSDLSVNDTIRVHDLSVIEPDLLAFHPLPGAKLLAVMRGDDERPPKSINVVLNFDSELERLAPHR